MAGYLPSTKWQKEDLNPRSLVPEPMCLTRHLVPLANSTVVGMKISKNISFDGNWPFYLVNGQVILMT